MKLILFPLCTVLNVEIHICLGNYIKGIFCSNFTDIFVLAELSDWTKKCEFCSAQALARWLAIVKTR